MIDHEEQEYPLRDGAATTWTRASDFNIRKLKFEFVEFLNETLPEVFAQVVVKDQQYRRTIRVIDIAEFKKILIKNRCFPEGHGKNYRLLEWTLQNKDYVEFMLL